MRSSASCDDMAMSIHATEVVVTPPNEKDSQIVAQRVTHI